MKKFIGALLFGLILLSVAFLVWPEKAYKPYQVDAAYLAQVEAYDLPDMPPDWVWKTYVANDGTRLRWGETGNVNAAKASVIWVPGYTATLDMYGEHIDAMARMGYHLIGIDMRGQGGSQRYRDAQPEKLWVSDFGVYASDLADFISILDLPSDRPLILSGMSFGGHVATRMIGDHDTTVDGLYLIAPALRPLSAPHSFEDAKRLMDVSRKLGKAKHYVSGQKNWQPENLDFTQGSDCSSNPKRLYNRDVVFTRKPEQRVGGITNQWGAEFFESSQYVMTPDYLEAIDLPITLISASDDTLVDTDINTQACDNRFPNCQEVIIPNSGHCLTQEYDEAIEILYQEIDGLLERIQSDL